jgi:hypothetical protein
METEKSKTAGDQKQATANAPRKPEPYQPPRYPSPSSYRRQPSNPQPQFTSASAAAVRAVQAMPSGDSTEEKRTWGDRWKDLWSKNEDGNKDRFGREKFDTGSSSRWNVWGANVRDEHARARAKAKSKKGGR